MAGTAGLRPLITQLEKLLNSKPQGKFPQMEDEAKEAEDPESKPKVWVSKYRENSGVGFDYSLNDGSVGELIKN